MIFTRGMRENGVRLHFLTIRVENAWAETCRGEMGQAGFCDKRESETLGLRFAGWPQRLLFSVTNPRARCFPP